MLALLAFTYRTLVGRGSRRTQRCIEGYDTCGQSMLSSHEPCRAVATRNTPARRVQGPSPIFSWVIAWALRDCDWAIRSLALPRMSLAPPVAPLTPPLTPLISRTKKPVPRVLEVLRQTVSESRTIQPALRQGRRSDKHETCFGRRR